VSPFDFRSVVVVLLADFCMSFFAGWLKATSAY
jgi:hypothetical protein